MLRNYVAASLRNMRRSRLYTSISILGLAVGLCSALLVALVLRHELSYERFIPGFKDTYLAVATLQPEGRPADYNMLTHSAVAGMLPLKHAEVQAATRLANTEVLIEQGQVAAKERVYWADPNAFEVLPLPLVAGELKQALRAANSVVLTRSMARKYFGREQVVGESLNFDRTQLMKVTAVIEDLPADATLLETGIFASGLSASSMLAQLDTDPNNALDAPGFQVTVRTYLRLKPDASIAPVQEEMPALMNAIWARRPPGLQATIQLVRIDKVHLFSGLNPGMAARLAVMAMVGLLVLLIACINFVNLTTARSTRRALEVGIRKTAGAGKSTLMLQFLGETLIYVVIATFIALVLAELLLSHVNAFLGSDGGIDYWSHPQILLLVALGALLLTALSGAYPSFILSAFRPADVLKGHIEHSRAAHRTRQVLVVLQFAIMIGLLICTGVVYQQLKYSTRDALRFDTDQVLMIKSPCNPALKTELRALSGVKSVSCVSESLLTGAAFGNFRLADGTTAAFDVVATEFGLFKVLGLQPIAGRFSTADASGDFTPADASRFVVNEAAMKRLGFSSPNAAVGQTLPFAVDPWAKTDTHEIIGVVKDFSIKTEEQIKPTIYYGGPRGFNLIGVKLAGKDIPETLRSIDRLWAATGHQVAIERYFLDDYIQEYYLSVRRRAQAMAIFSCVAVLLASLGLLGLAASTTERRVKEIGVRKALGASTNDIVRLLVWQFTRPVFWACLVSWPIAAYLMNRWLNGFAYHVDLSPGLFVSSTVIAVIIAIATVIVHCLLVARSKPVTALRYE